MSDIEVYNPVAAETPWERTLTHDMVRAFVSDALRGNRNGTSRLPTKFRAAINALVVQPLNDGLAEAARRVGLECVGQSYFEDRHCPSQIVD